MSMISIFRMQSSETNRTILGPRESYHWDVNSVFGALTTLEDKEIKHLRKKFYWKTLCFTVSIVSMFRFPKEVLQYDNKAIYVYLYIFYSIVFGLPILLFEMAAGHFYTKGFARIFSFSPVFQGITISMLCYCMVTNIFYSYVNIYSLHYFFISFKPSMVHSLCNLDWSNCANNATNYTYSPEYFYFYEYVARAYDSKGTLYWYSFILYLLLWICAFLVIYFIITKHTFVTISITCFTVVTVTFTTIACLCYQNLSSFSLETMFIPKGPYKNFALWIEPLEQVFLSFGFGLGPLLTYWSFSNFKIWSHKYCILVFILTLFSTICSGFIIFCAVDGLGIDVFEEDVQMFPLLGRLFNLMTPGLNNFVFFIFYLMMTITSLFIIIECTKIVIFFIRTYLSIKQFRRFYLISILTSIFAILTYCAHLWGEVELSAAIDKIFLGPAVLFIVFCELTSVMYFYGVHDFCDDIEFLLGYYPNFFYQVVWKLTPIFTLIYLFCSLAIKVSKMHNNYDIFMLVLVFGIIVAPTLGIFLYKCVMGIKNQTFAQQLNVRMTDLQSNH